MINFLKNSFPCDSLNTDSYLQLLLNDILTSCYNVTCIMIPHILYRDNLWTPASCWLETRPHYIVTLMTSDQYVQVCCPCPHSLVMTLDSVSHDKIWQDDSAPPYFPGTTRSNGWWSLLACWWPGVLYQGTKVKW